MNVPTHGRRRLGVCDSMSTMLVLGFVLFSAMCNCQRPNLDASKRHDVYIAGFFPYGRNVENSDTGRGVMPSVKLALDHVNEHSAILRNYRLHMWWNDTMCNAAVGVKAFFDMMHSGPHKLMLFGAACTHVTDPIAKASKHWHLTQLSYADTHPMFTKENFPNFFRIVPSENAFNSPRLSLLKEFNWTRVGTIYQNEPRYSLAHNRLVAELDTLGYQVVETQSFTNEVVSALGKLKEKDTRVILGNFNETWARHIFCEAHKFEMYGRKYQWVIMGTYSQHWWRKNDSTVNCTLDELELALEQTILTDLLPLSTNGEITISGITADEYKTEYNSRRGDEYSRFHGYTYDGIWAVALAIQHAAHKIRYFYRNQTVSDFRYRDPIWERVFLDALHNTSFEGVTGPVRFYDNERKASILLKQFQDGDEVKVGEYSAATQHLDLTLGEPLKWIGRQPPKDRTLLIIEHTRVNKTVYAILATLAVCGIVMASVFLAFNIRYRNQRYIKMSSPQLNNLIIIGCMLTYTSIVFLGLDSGLSSIEAFPYICTARVWTLMAGFSLAFGAMFSKTWRVHSIFTDVKLNKKIIKDYKLFMVVGVLLVIDLVIMTTWQVADPFFRETKQLGAYPHPSSEDIIIIPENEYCASEHMTIFVGLIYVYKGILMIFGAFLAWETRHVSIPALNDSRHVGLSVYNVAIMCICGAAVALVLVDHQDALFLIIGVFVMFCTTATLWLVFVPKMLELRRNPGGSIDKRIRATLRPMSKTRRDSSVSELESKLKDVKALNCKYRKTLLDKEGELQTLIGKLGSDEVQDILREAARADSMSRLSVPLVRREAPSATETSDITSLCSLSSQDFASLHHSDSQKKKRQVCAIVSGGGDNDINDIPPSLPPDSHITMATRHENGVPTNIINKTEIVLVTPIKQPATEATTTPKINNILSNAIITTTTTGNSTPKRRSSMKSTTHHHHHHHHQDNNKLNNNNNDDDSSAAATLRHRRVSVPGNQQKRQLEMVAKSELWNTGGGGGGGGGGGQPHRCSVKKRGVSISPVSPSSVSAQQLHHHDFQEEGNNSFMHRTVSEKNRSSHSHLHQQPQVLKRDKDSSTSSKTTEEGCTTTNHHVNKLGGGCYFQSTPNVAAANSREGGGRGQSKTLSRPPNKRDKSIYNAASESELLDREILPIFQKLLTERNKSQHNIDYSTFGRSCPNISIKCDIVEYL